MQCVFYNGFKIAFESKSNSNLIYCLMEKMIQILTRLSAKTDICRNNLVAYHLFYYSRPVHA